MCSYVHDGNTISCFLFSDSSRDPLNYWLSSVKIRNFSNHNEAVMYKRFWSSNLASLFFHSVSSQRSYEIEVYFVYNSTAAGIQLTAGNLGSRLIQRQQLIPSMIRVCCNRSPILEVTSTVHSVVVEVGRGFSLLNFSFRDYSIFKKKVLFRVDIYVMIF